MEENKDLVQEIAAAEKNLTDRELLEEISRRLTAIEKRQKKDSIRRWVTFGVVVLVIAILALIIVPWIVGVVNDYNELIETISEYKAALDSINLENIDFSGVERAANALNDIDFEKLAGMLEELELIDFDALSEAVNRITSITNTLGGLFG